MKKLNLLANQVNKCVEPGIKQLWTDKWYQLVKQYAKEINYEHESKRSSTVSR